MNISLLDPAAYIRACPEYIEAELRLPGPRPILESSGKPQIAKLKPGKGPMSLTCLSFSKRGNYLAGGTDRGSVLIWDFDTRQICLDLKHPLPTEEQQQNDKYYSLRADSHFITSLSWDRTNRYLLTSDNKGTIIYWDLMDGSLKNRFYMDFEMILSVQLHPKNAATAVIGTSNGAFVIDLATSFSISMMMPSFTPIYLSEHNIQQIQLPPEVWDESYDSSKAMRWITATHNHKGDRILLGGPKGHICIVDSQSLAVLHTAKAGGQQVKTIIMSARGRQYLANCSDKALRLFDSDTNACVATFQDSVSRRQFQCFGFSGLSILGDDSDFVIAADVGGSEHKIYIWDRVTHRLQPFLHCPSDQLRHIAWHPFRPIVAACTDTGSIFIWSKTFSEKWAAWAPDFKEVDGNVEYLEREDEFDIKPESSHPWSLNLSAASKHSESDEEADVDIETVERSPLDSSSDEDEEEQRKEKSFFIPTIPQPDPTEEEIKEEKMRKKIEKKAEMRREKEAKKKKREAERKKEADKKQQQISSSVSKRSSTAAAPSDSVAPKKRRSKKNKIDASSTPALTKEKEKKKEKLKGKRKRKTKKQSKFEDDDDDDDDDDEDAENNDENTRRDEHDDGFGYNDDGAGDEEPASNRPRKDLEASHDGDQEQASSSSANASANAMDTMDASEQMNIILDGNSSS